MRIKSIVVHGAKKVKTESNLVHDNWAFISIGFIYLCYVHLYNFYQCFGLNVFRYMEADELLANFIPLLIKYGFGILILILVLFNHEIKTEIGQAYKEKAFPIIIFLSIITLEYVLDYANTQYMFALRAQYLDWFDIWISTMAIGSFITSIGLLYIVVSYIFNKRRGLVRLKFIITLFICITLYGEARKAQGYMELLHPFKSDQYYFKSEGKIISTKEYRFVTETRNYIVMMDKFDIHHNICKLHFYNKASIDSLVVESWIKSSHSREEIAH